MDLTFRNTSDVVQTCTDCSLYGKGYSSASYPALDDGDPEGTTYRLAFSGACTWTGTFDYGGYYERDGTLSNCSDADRCYFDQLIITVDRDSTFTWFVEARCSNSAGTCSGDVEVFITTNYSSEGVCEGWYDQPCSSYFAGWKCAQSHMQDIYQVDGTCDMEFVQM